MTSEMQST